MASTNQPLSAYSPDTCMFCRQLLCIMTNPDTESDSEFDHPLERGEAATVIDDVELYCGPPGSGPGGHHTHWTCLIDHTKQARTCGVISNLPATGGASAFTTFTTCVVCGQNTLDSFGRFVVDVRNEGGETKRFDFGMILVRSVVSLPLPPPLSSVHGHKTMLIRIGHGYSRSHQRRMSTLTRTWDV